MKNKLITVLILTCLFLIVCVSMVQPADIANIAEDVAPTVVMITTVDNRIGAGFFISFDGYIVTNAHIVKSLLDYPFVTVHLHNGERLEATIENILVDIDLALLKITKEGFFQSVHLGDSDNIRMGETVFTIGHPFGLHMSLTKGVISHTNRDLAIGDFWLTDLIQTDMSVNPGNSGGPVFNTKGNVIGIVGGMVKQALNINYALPINQVKENFLILEKD